MTKAMAAGVPCLHCVPNPAAELASEPSTLQRPLRICIASSEPGKKHPTISLRQQQLMCSNVWPMSQLDDWLPLSGALLSAGYKGKTRQRQRHDRQTGRREVAASFNDVVVILMTLDLTDIFSSSSSLPTARATGLAVDGGPIGTPPLQSIIVIWCDEKVSQCTHTSERERERE